MSPRRHSRRDAPAARLGVAFAAALAAACSHEPPPPPPVLAPPLVELAEIGAIGMIDFSAAGPKDLAPLASREFLATLQSAQPGVAVLELGPRERVLAAVGGAALEPETIRAIGDRYELDAILVGEVETHETRPRVSMREADSFTARAEIEGVLHARLFETRRGATLWSGSAETRAPLARIELSPWGVGDFDAREPERVRSEIVRELVSQATADFQPRWVQP
jgi:hypothetical protein